MIVEHQVQGSTETTLHNFTITQTGMTLTISAGNYVQSGVERMRIEEETSVVLDPAAEDTPIVVWLTETGIAVLPFQALVDDAVDRLAWFTLPAGAESLDDVEINVVSMTLQASI